MTAYLRRTFLWVAAALLPACSGEHPDPPPPPDAAPTSLLLTVISSSRIDQSWTDTSSNEAGFLIRRSTDGTGKTLSGISTIQF